MTSHLLSMDRCVVVNFTIRKAIPKMTQQELSLTNIDCVKPVPFPCISPLQSLSIGYFTTTAYQSTPCYDRTSGPDGVCNLAVGTSLVKKKEHYD